MRARYQELAFTPNVEAVQEQHGSRSAYADYQTRHSGNEVEGLTPREEAFIAEQHGFYLASVSETGWPYVQFRGGPTGFLKVIGPRTLAFADFRGNRQYITTGNIRSDNRVALIIMDYVRQARLKVLGRLTVEDADAVPEQIAALVHPGYKATPERVATIAVEAYDWNCPQHITPKFTAEQVDAAVAPLRNRISELEAEVARLSAGAS